MIQDVLVPQMGESVLEGTILEWKVKVGDRVTINQPLVELMTDKVNIEIPAEWDGVVTEQLAKVGQVVPVGAKIAVIDDGKEGVATAKTSAKPATIAKPAAVAAVPVPTAPVSLPAGVKATAGIGKGKLSPKIRMMIREYGVDPNAITPTGKDGLVTSDDVMRSVASRSSAAGFIAAPAPLATLHAQAAQAPIPVVPKVNVQIPVFPPMPEAMRETRMPLVGARKAIADHMVASKRTSAHVTTFEDFDLTELARYRRAIKKNFVETYGVNITYLPFVVRAVCIALKEYPTINASLTDKEIVLKNYYNIGVAVARDEGLIVPVIKNADKKTIVELAYEISLLGEKARKSQLVPDDVSGGTFSVTNAGMFGATASTPIIAQPQVAILGVHAIVKRPWVVNDEIVIREISSFGLSFDHRLIDGHTAVKFLHRIHELLADPNQPLLHVS
jgi:2-oxoglutarate dehydrogenase complex dihydrolipoamide succinyltransferase (E2) component